MARTTLFGNSASPTTAHISDISVTEDTLTERAGLALFSRYVRGTGIFDQKLFRTFEEAGIG